MASDSHIHDLKGRNPAAITLLGREQARVGHRFIYSGPLQDCRECQLKNICFNLVEGRRYLVKHVREKAHPCAVFEDGVRVVEVERVPFRAGIPRSMIVEGSVITFHPQGCRSPDCSDYLLERPPDVPDGTRIRIIGILSEHTCPDGRRFREALVDFAD